MTSKSGGLFESLVGFEYDFYGVDGNSFCIGLEGKKCAFEAIEDPADGYRSYLESVQVSTSDKIFFPTALGRVLLKRSTNYDLKGYCLKDVDTGHKWLEFGTDECDDYYPLFTFRYRARPPDAVQLAVGKCSCCHDKFDDDDTDY